MRTSYRGAPGFLKRIAFILTGIAAGAASLLTLRLFIPYMPWEIIFFYEMFVAAGGTIAGAFVALIPARFIASLPWPLCVLTGTLMGPLALALLFFVIFAAQGQLNRFSLAHLDFAWVFSVLASAPSFIVYAALLKRELRLRLPK